ncbi:MAG TPA: c-type cytochrome, partial [Chloroflexota bacterium]|nr:c-type cytochrome [Chloroflexota bacterium]
MAGPGRDVLSLFALTVRAEVVLAVIVVVFVGIMTSISPAQQAISTTSGGPLTLDAPAGDLQATLGISPGRPGSNRYIVEVRDSGGQPATAVSRATLRLTFLDSDLGVTEVALSQTGVGRFEAQSSDLAIAGRWQAEAIFRRNGQDDVRATYQFAVTDAGGQILSASPPQVTILFFAGLLVGLIGILGFFRAAKIGRFDPRRAAVLAACGVGLLGSGVFVSLQDFQRAQAEASSLALSRFHPITPESVANGALVYQENCVRCHGADAHGNGPLAPTLNPRPSDLILHVPLHPDADLVDWITNGFPGSAMPAFKTVLTEQQRWDVLNYLKSRTAQVAAPVPTATVPAATIQSSGAPASTPQSTSAASGQPRPRPSTAATVLTPSPTPVTTQTSNLLSASNGTLAGDVPVGDLIARIVVKPLVFQPASIDLEIRDANGQLVSDIARLDLQIAMEGMNHGARGIAPTVVGPGRYHAQAMLFAMQGKWWLAIRIERTGQPISATIVRLDVPRDNSTGAVSAMYERPAGAPQVEDIAVYPDAIAPNRISVVAGRAVRLELFYVDSPACGQGVSFPELGATATISASGLGELDFVPKQTGTIEL